WAASGAGYFWPIWVLIPTVFVLIRRLSGTDVESRVRHRHRHHHVAETQASDATPPAQRPASEPQFGRVVMSVLFVDIVASTERAAALGDAAWQSLLADYERRVASALKEYGGETLFTKGDEVVAGFALPGAGVRCAQRIRDEARAAGLEVRAGVHAGEV